MNRITMWNRLLHDCHRSVYSISGDVHSHDIINVNNVRFFQQHSKSSELTLSACPNHEKTLATISPAQNDAIKAKTFVYSSSNKISAFCASGGRRDYQLFYHQSSILAASSNESNSFNSIRHFSDSSNTNVNIPTPMQLEGLLKDLSESAAVEFCQNGLVSLHTATGLPWWATILLATWGLRSAITLPLALYQSYIFAKVENLKYEMDYIVQDLKMEANYAVQNLKWTENYARKVYNQSLKKEWQKLIERENCHPMKSRVLVIIQLPMWIILSTSLRNLCYMLPHPTERAYAIYLELTTGGFGWITNLAAVDHFFAIPITLGLLNLTIIEIQQLMRSTEPTKREKYLVNFFRLVAVGMVPLASYIPACISLYWASSSAFGIIQNLLIMSPRVRRLARIPPTDSELEEPYRHLYKKLRRRIGLKEVSLPNAIKKM